MLEAYFRQTFQSYFVNPIAERLVKLFRVRPEAITLWAGAVGLSVIPALIAGHSFLACLFLLISGYLDTLDGTVARAADRASPQGAALDIVCDRVVEAAVILALFAVNPLHRGWWCLGMLTSILLCVTSFLVVGIFTENDGHKSFHYSPGVMERAEAFIFFLTMILIPQWFEYFAGLFILLTMYTACVRVWQFRK